ncbi:MAG: peptide chain release factor N(5)-glutamine methyltransferase [Pseudomonadota bacterium]
MRRAARALAAAGVPDPGREARLLMRWAGGMDAAALVVRGAAAMGPAAGRFRQGVAARATRRPLAQITGERLFWGRAFRVTADTLDPRPETECVVATLLQGRPAARVLDLGTGTGCLLVTLLAAWPEAAGVGTDRSAAALAVARANAASHGTAERARFACGDWYAALAPAEAAFDLIVSNPPYVTAAELAVAAPELAHEPAVALVPDPDPLGDGLGAYRRIVAEAPRWLVPGGRIALEVGSGQAQAVAALLAAAGLPGGVIVPDFDGRGRVVVAEAPENGR